MSVLRNIAIITLNLVLILESSSLSVVALSNEDIAVNSLEVLSLPIETIDQEIASNISTEQKTEIKPALKLDIESLLDANREYSKQNPKTIEESSTIVESDISTTDILSSLGGSGVFGDFLIASDTQLLE